MMFIDMPIQNSNFASAEAEIPQNHCPHEAENPGANKDLLMEVTPRAQINKLRCGFSFFWAKPQSNELALTLTLETG